MSTSLIFYTDAGLTTEANGMTINHLVDGSTDPQDITLYLGSTVSANKFEKASNPGVDDIVASIANATALWLANTAYVTNNKVRTTAKNGYRYKVQSITGGGLSHATTEPTWPVTVGNTVVDNQVTWVNDGPIHEATEIKLALSSGGLATAVAGDPLTVATQILGGVSNAIPIYMRIDDATAVISSVSELGTAALGIKESVI